MSWVKTHTGPHRGTFITLISQSCMDRDASGSTSVGDFCSIRTTALGPPGPWTESLTWTRDTCLWSIFDPRPLLWSVLAPDDPGAMDRLAPGPSPCDRPETHVWAIFDPRPLLWSVLAPDDPGPMDRLAPGPSRCDRPDTHVWAIFDPRPLLWSFLAPSPFFWLVFRPAHFWD